MYDRLRWGSGLGIYRDRRAASEIEDAYKAARRAGNNERVTVAAMTEVIEAQVARHEYVSRHLAGQAVDLVAIGGMTRHRVDVLARIVTDAGADALKEANHVHLQFR